MVDTERGEAAESDASQIMGWEDSRKWDARLDDC